MCPRRPNGKMKTGSCDGYFHLTQMTPICVWLLVLSRQFYVIANPSPSCSPSAPPGQLRSTSWAFMLPWHCFPSGAQAECEPARDWTTLRVQFGTTPSPVSYLQNLSHRQAHSGSMLALGPWLHAPEQLHPGLLKMQSTDQIRGLGASARNSASKSRTWGQLSRCLTHNSVSAAPASTFLRCLAGRGWWQQLLQGKNWLCQNHTRIIPHAGSVSASFKS